MSAQRQQVAVAQGVEVIPLPAAQVRFTLLPGAEQVADPADAAGGLGGLPGQVHLSEIQVAASLRGALFGQGASVVGFLVKARLTTLAGLGSVAGLDRLARLLLLLRRQSLILLGQAALPLL